MYFDDPMQCHCIGMHLKSHFLSEIVPIGQCENVRGGTLRLTRAFGAATLCLENNNCLQQ